MQPSQFILFERGDGAPTPGPYDFSGRFIAEICTDGRVYIWPIEKTFFGDRSEQRPDHIQDPQYYDVGDFVCTSGYCHSFKEFLSMEGLNPNHYTITPLGSYETVVLCREALPMSS